MPDTTYTIYPNKYDEPFQTTDPDDAEFHSRNGARVTAETTGA